MTGNTGLQYCLGSLAIKLGLEQTLWIPARPSERDPSKRSDLYNPNGSDFFKINKSIYESELTANYKQVFMHVAILEKIAS